MATSRYPDPIQLIGPMTGIEDYNYPAFNYFADNLRQVGWTVINPAENFDGQVGLPRHRYMARTVYTLIRYAKVVLLLPGWAKSEGALLETELAVNLSYGLYSVDTVRRQILVRHRDEIKEILNGRGAVPVRGGGDGSRSAPAYRADLLDDDTRPRPAVYAGRHGRSEGVPVGDAEGGRGQVPSYANTDFPASTPGFAYDQGRHEVPEGQLEEG